MNALDLVIVVDNKIRDLTGCVLLKRKLEKLGLSVRLCPNGHEYEMLFFKPKAIIHNHMREEHKTEIGTLQKRIDVKAIVVPTENIMRENRDVMQLYVGKFWCEFDNIDLYISWGEVIRQVLIEDCGMAPHRVIALGSPRTDLFHPPFQEKKDVGELKTALYTSSHQYGSWAREVAMKKLVGCDFDKLTSFTVDEYYDEDRRAFIDYLDSMRLAVKRFSNINFIIKPHPFEDFEPYRKLEKDIRGCQNVKVEYSAPFNSIAKDADMIIHAGTVASVEAWFMGIPTLCLEYFCRKSCHYPEMIAGSVRAQNVEDLFSYLSDFRRLQHDFAARQKDRELYIKRWLTSADGKRSEVIAEAVRERIAPYNNPSIFRVFSAMIGRYGLLSAMRYYLRYWRRGRTSNFLPNFSEAHRQQWGDDTIAWLKRKVFTKDDLSQTERFIDEAYGKSSRPCGHAAAPR